MGSIEAYGTVDRRRYQVRYRDGPEDQGEHFLNQPTIKGRWWVQAIARAQAIDPAFPKPTIHDLRHTAASLAVSAGAIAGFA